MLSQIAFNSAGRLYVNPTTFATVERTSIGNYRFEAVRDGRKTAGLVGDKLTAERLAAAHCLGPLSIRIL